MRRRARVAGCVRSTIALRLCCGSGGRGWAGGIAVWPARPLAGAARPRAGRSAAEIREALLEFLQRLHAVAAEVLVEERRRRRKRAAIEHAMPCFGHEQIFDLDVGLLQ